MRIRLLVLFVIAINWLCPAGAFAQGAPNGQTYRLYDGITAYVLNPEGKEFSIHLELRDINIMSQGPREVLYKVYDPEGTPVVREILPDDNVPGGAFPDRIGGWCDEMQYYYNLYAKGTKPAFRWSAWTEPERLKTIVPQVIERKIAGGKKGTYRVVIVGVSDKFATVKFSPDLKYGVTGHTIWMHGHHSMLKKSFIYVPKGTSGVFFACVEPDQPQGRTFKLTAPDGKVLWEGKAIGGYKRAGANANSDSPIQFKPGEYDGQLMTLEVSDGPGDYLVKVTLQQPKEGVFKEYTGMGSGAIFCDDAQTANAIQGGTFVEDGLVFWHPFQAKFHRWLKANPLDKSDEQKALRKELDPLFDAFRLFETCDGRGTAGWTNWSYAFGYYGCRIWKRSWLLMARPDVPAEVKAIIREALIMAGDRLSFATMTESVNGNAFAQIPVELWYGHRATGDALQKARFEVFWDRWKNGGWGEDVGISKSGDAQEFHAHDAHYGSYIMDNWKAAGNTWVAEGGILGDAKDDPRFQQVMDRYYELYTHLYCREQDKRAVAANPWSARTHMHPHKEATNWEHGQFVWKGEPGPDFTTSVNGGDEWFAARRKSYYAVTFHGRIGPEWQSRSFPGQLGFGGGILAQLTVPGKGPVLVSTQTESYGTGMDPSNWRNMRINSIVGEMWDGRPLIAAISEHKTGRLEGTKVSSAGEVRDTHVKIARSFTFNADSITCEAQLATSDYSDILSVWSWPRYWSEVKFAYEMIPFMPLNPAGKPTVVTLLGADGKDLGPITTTPTEAKTIRIDRGGFGVEVRLESPLKVLLGGNSNVLIQIVEEPKLAPGQQISSVPPKPTDKDAVRHTPAEKVAIKYSLVPYGN